MDAALPLMRQAHAPVHRTGAGVTPVAPTSGAARGGPLRLLVSAYACAPGRGSEHGVGWNWARELAQRAEVWVVTRERRRAEIEAWEREHGRVGVHWVYHECPRWLLRAKKLIGIHGYYHVWQRLLLPRARLLHRAAGFDAVFHLTMNGFREPGYLWRLPCRFVWGPIGGLQDAAAPFLAFEDPRVRTQERVRGWINRFTARFAARPRAARARAELLMAANGEAHAWATERGRSALRLLEAGAPEAPPRHAVAGEEILWVGSDEPRKNPRFAVAAFAAVRRLHPGATLTVVGLSPRRQRELTEWARQRRLTLEGVTMRARVPRDELAAFYGRAAQFWFTSWRDTSGNVLIEAVAHGTPCLAFDHQGAADILADGAGVLIPPGQPRGMLAAWVLASHRLLRDPHDASALGRIGASAVRARLAWSRKAELVVGALNGAGARR